MNTQEKDHNSVIQIAEQFSDEFLRDTEIVPLEINENTLTVLTPRSNDIYLLQRLEKLTGLRIKFHPCDVKELESRLERLQENLDQLKGVSEEFRLEVVIDDGDEERYEGLDDGSEVDGPIVKLIDTLIGTGLKKRVSDIHIECAESSVSVKYRIDGVLYPATVDLDITYHASLVSRLKVMAELDIAEKRIPQDGRFKLRLGKKYIDFRISVIPGLYGENVVIRVLDNYLVSNNPKLMTLDAMGFSEKQKQTFWRSINEPHGMVLVTGPTGSGKTTTLYSALKAINTGQQKIITIEDPVEYQLDGIMQIPVNPKKGLTFAKGLRSILRHDPDKVMVGEIRDLETAEIAVQTALTGHLVLSTIHANNSFDVLARLKNIGVSLYSCMSALNCILSQRLIRLNCNSCQQEVSYNNHYLEESGLLDSSIKLFRGNGCQSCASTGYSGRTMICEILNISEKMKEGLVDDTPIPELLASASYVDDINLRKSALNLLFDGRVSLEEVNRVTFHR